MMHLMPGQNTHKSQLAIVQGAAKKSQPTSMRLTTMTHNMKLQIILVA